MCTCLRPLSIAKVVEKAPEKMVGSVERLEVVEEVWVQMPGEVVELALHQEAVAEVLRVMHDLDQMHSALPVLRERVCVRLWVEEEQASKANEIARYHSGTDRNHRRCLVVCSAVQMVEEVGLIVRELEVLLKGEVVEALAE